MLHAPQVAVLLIVVAASASVVFAEDATTSYQYQAHHPPLLHCTPARSKNGDGAFRANLASALGALPSAAAAAPKGFATARSGGTGRNRAFARGLCLGANASSPAASRACRACLSAAARDVTAGCGASRRAGVWRAGCFLAYADADADVAPARDDAFRGWFYVAPNTAVTPDRACAADRSAADCDRCFEESAKAAAALRWRARIRGEQVLVVGYTCCLRVQISVLPQGPGYTDARQFALGVWFCIMLFIVEITLIITFCGILDNL